MWWLAGAAVSALAFGCGGESGAGDPHEPSTGGTDQRRRFRHAGRGRRRARQDRRARAADPAAATGGGGASVAVPDRRGRRAGDRGHRPLCRLATGTAVEPPAPPAYSGGTCPTFAPGANTFKSGGVDRKFLLIVPAAIQQDEKLPLVFLWHWLKGEAQDFVDKAEVQKAVDAQRFIAVVPEQKGDLLFVWPVELFQSQSRIDEELALFDDLLSCVGAQLDVNRSCVSSAGVSAGALWTDQLAHLRSQYLSSFISLSGGVGGFAIKPWGNPQRAIPGMCCGWSHRWRGAVQLRDAVKSWRNLTQGSHFLLECIAADTPATFRRRPELKYEGLWHSCSIPVLAHACAFALRNRGSFHVARVVRHRRGNATPKTGACIDPSQC
jgi:hypothetical protein